MAVQSKSATVFLQRLGILPAEPALPFRTICPRELSVNVVPVAVPDASAAEIRSADRLGSKTGHMTSRRWRLVGSVVVSAP